MKKIPVICIVGPTASGKTSLGISVAKLFNGEIVSADSMQVYQKMNIATAKPSQQELSEVQHHLIGFLNPAENFSVAQYVNLAQKIINDIHSRGKVPVIVGGTGLYIDSLLNNIDFIDECSDNTLRKELNELARDKGADYMLNILNEFDTPAAQTLAKEKNLRRIVRAIEVYKLTGITFTEHNIKSRNETSPYDVLKIGLTAQDREFLYSRIDKRVDIMLKEGLIQETIDFYNKPSGETSAKAIGYKELKPYLDNIKSLDECIEKLKRETRRYAKRQLTWFRRDKEINWFYIDLLNESQLANQVTDFIKSKGFEFYG